MAKKKKKNDEDVEAEATEEGGKGKRGALLPAIVVAVAVLGAGAMAGGVFGGGGDQAEAAPTEQVEATPTPEALGTVVELDSVTLNLSGEGSHFLKLGVAVELSPDTAEEPPTAPIYDAVIDQFGSYTYQDLATPTLRESTKDDLLENLAEIYGDQITRVFYTEFVMQ